VLATTTILVLMVGICAGYAQPMGPGMMGPGYGYPEQEGWNYCPYCGSYTGPGSGYGMGPWMMGRGYGGYGMMGPGYGYGMGPGMMGHMMGGGYGGYGMMGPGHRYGYGPHYGYRWRHRQPAEPLDEAQAKQEVENYLKSTRNPNLKMGKIEDKGNDYEVGIETKDGSLVNKLLVNKDTGWMRSVY
jgi:hypothetical protein